PAAHDHSEDPAVHQAGGLVVVEAPLQHHRGVRQEAQLVVPVEKDRAAVHLAHVGAGLFEVREAVPQGRVHARASFHGTYPTRIAWRESRTGCVPRWDAVGQTARSTAFVTFAPVAASMAA